MFSAATSRVEIIVMTPLVFCFGWWEAMILHGPLVYSVLSFHPVSCRQITSHSSGLVCNQLSISSYASVLRIPVLKVNTLKRCLGLGELRLGLRWCVGSGCSRCDAGSAPRVALVCHRPLYQVMPFWDARARARRYARLCFQVWVCLWLVGDPCAPGKRRMTSRHRKRIVSRPGPVMCTEDDGFLLVEQRCVHV